MIDAIDELAQALGQLGFVYLRIHEYRETHGHLELVLTRDGRRCVLLMRLTECFYIGGPTFGGPYLVTVTQELDGQDRIVVIRGGDEFVAKALRVSFSLDAQPSFGLENSDSTPAWKG